MNASLCIQTALFVCWPRLLGSVRFTIFSDVGRLLLPNFRLLWPSMAPAHSKHTTEKDKKKPKKKIEKGEPVAKPTKAEKLKKGKEIMDATRKSALRSAASSTAPATRVHGKSAPKTFVYCTPPDKTTSSLKSPSEVSVPVQVGKKVEKSKDGKKKEEEVVSKKEKKEKPAKPEKKKERESREGSQGQPGEAKEKA